jgi:alpha-1,3-rhamnosyl/mannosyltransferase
MNAPIILDARTATTHFPGIGRYVVNLATALTQVAPDLHIELLHDPMAATRLPLPDLPRHACTASPFSIRQQWAVPRLIRQLGAAVYHSPYFLMPYLPGVPSVVTCYDLIPLIYPQYFSATQRLIFRVAHMLAVRTARRVLAISEASKTDLLRTFGIDTARVVVTPLAADSHFTPQPAESITAVRRKYALPEHYVLYFGSNKPHKNLTRLVKAWKMQNVESRFARASGTACRMQNVELVIGGHWDQRHTDAKLAVEESGLKDEVKFIGPVADIDLPALYSGALLFVFPSLYEGFGLPALEAMACGTPVACSNTSSLPEVVGDAGLTFDPQHVEAIADSLGRALGDPELLADLRRRGLQRAAQFTWERVARQTLDVYERVWRA